MELKSQLQDDVPSIHSHRSIIDSSDLQTNQTCLYDFDIGSYIEGKDIDGSERRNFGRLTGSSLSITPCPVYSSALKFEKEFSGLPFVDFLRNQYYVVILITLVYLIVIQVGQRLMANRRPIQARRFSIVWNFLLSVFSIIGFHRTGYESWLIFSRYGYDGMICHPLTLNGPNFFWMLLYVWSKVWEFGDSILLILKKKPIIFLHYYHHSSVLMLCSYTFGRLIPLNRVYGVMNLFAHSLMYPYFTVTSIGIRPPKFMSMCLTTIQIIQMVFGIVTSVHYLNHCGNSSHNYPIIISILIYISYFILFMQFFAKSYFSSRKTIKHSNGSLVQEESISKVEVNGNISKKTQ